MRSTLGYVYPVDANPEANFLAPTPSFDSVSRFFFFVLADNTKI